MERIAETHEERVMDGPPAGGNDIGYTLGGAAAASLIVLLVAMLALGADLTLWPEWEGRLVGVAGTIAAVAGAVVGLRFAMRGDSRRVK